MSCVLSAASFKPAFSTFSLDKRGKKCMGDSWRPIALPTPGLGPEIHVHNTHADNRYFKYGSFITANNLHHPAVLSTFLAATRLMQQCIDSEEHQFEFGGENIEITIIVRCVSPSDPKISYYIADHANQTIKWLHDQVPRCYETDAVRMRDRAEYWHHRSKFPVHKHCTPEDREEVVTLLNDMLNQGGADLDRRELQDYVRRLDNILPSTAFTDHQTKVIAEVHSEALKLSLPAFYSPGLKGMLYKSLMGLSMPRFVHNRTHGNTGTSMSRVIHEHLRPPSHLNPRSPHSGIHTNTPPPAPSSSHPN